MDAEGIANWLTAPEVGTQKPAWHNDYICRIETAGKNSQGFEGLADFLHRPEVRQAKNVVIPGHWVTKLGPRTPPRLWLSIRFEK